VKVHDFTTKFEPVLKLSSDMTDELAVKRILMTCTWDIITPEYENNAIQYSPDGGVNWETTIFVNGVYSYTDLDDYNHEFMKRKGNVKADGTYDINITFVLPTYKVVTEIENNYQLDFRNTKFGELLGFQPKLITQTEYGSELPNI